jgi:hypothetical protein
METIKFSDFMSKEVEIKEEQSSLGDAIWIAITIAVIIASVKLGISLPHHIGGGMFQPIYL